MKLLLELLAVMGLAALVLPKTRIPPLVTLGRKSQRVLIHWVALVALVFAALAYDSNKGQGPSPSAVARALKGDAQ